MSAQVKEGPALRQMPMPVRTWVVIGLAVVLVAAAALGVRALTQGAGAPARQTTGITAGRGEAEGPVSVTGTGPDLITVAGPAAPAAAISGTGPDLVQVARSQSAMPQVTGTGPDLIQVASHRGPAAPGR